MIRIVEKILERAGILATREESVYFDWADRLMDLYEERRRRDRLAWRDGGPGSGTYELWRRSWNARHTAVMRERYPEISAAEIATENRIARRLAE